MNALKTGLRAKSLVLPTESPEDLQQLIDEYYALYQPATPEARGILDDLLICEWTLRRLAETEASLNQYQVADSFNPVPKAHRAGKVALQCTKTLTALQRRIDATRRGRDRALAQLRELTAEPLAMPAPPRLPAESAPIESITSSEIGFVRSHSPIPPATPAAAPNPDRDANSDDPEASPTVG